MTQSPNEYSLQETIDGQQVTYDAEGNVTGKNFSSSKSDPVDTSPVQEKRRELDAHPRRQHALACPRENQGR